MRRDNESRVDSIENLSLGELLSGTGGTTPLKEKSWEDLMPSSPLPYEELQKEYIKAMSRLRKYHKDRETLRSKFEVLHGKYTNLKSEMHHVLWSYLPKHHSLNDFSCIPPVDNSIFETIDRIGEYKIKQLLGEGRYSDVKLGYRLSEENDHKEPLAIKILPKKRIVGIASLQRIHTEIEFLKAFDHPNIVALLDVVNSPDNIYLVTELAGKDLYDFFESHPLGVCQNISQNIMYGISQAVCFIHSKGYCHRDLKPENILLDFNSTKAKVKLCDFGHCSKQEEYASKCFSGLCGSPGFFAPEMVLSSNTGQLYSSGSIADVWSLGCILLELILGYNSFDQLWMAAYEPDVLCYNFDTVICNALYQVELEVINMMMKKERGGIDEELLLLLKSLLDVDVGRRLPSNQFSTIAWLSPFKYKTEEDLLPRLVPSSSTEDLSDDDWDNNDNDDAAESERLEKIIFP